MRLKPRNRPSRPPICKTKFRLISAIFNVFLRRITFANLGYEPNPCHALCSLELEHAWLLFNYSLDDYNYFDDNDNDDDLEEEMNNGDIFLKCIVSVVALIRIQA